MKSKLILALSFFSLLLLPFGTLRAQNLESISMAIQTGNAKEVAKYFDSSVEITVYNSEGVYSKAQAEMVLRDFFSKNPPTAFSLIHKGNSTQGSQYGIGTLSTSNGNFRAYIYVKQKGTTYFIQEIRFEKS
ncbi:MAG: DUF4783 domain-containing protein [Chitinophagales bacterium]|nr:DUF4783 domain-containing protein [Chitinophagales bacterium]